MRILVTGAGGFVGSHLIPLLQEKGHTVYAGGILPSHFIRNSHVNFFMFDVRNQSELDSVIKDVRPEGIIHLAAQSMVVKSWNDPAETLMINTLGTVNLIKSVVSHAPKCKMLTIGTSEEYGITGKSGIALTEECECLPQNPYAISKLCSAYMALQLASRHNIDLVHIRPFNHFGPGQPEGFVISDFASQIAKIEMGILPPVIRVGDLSSQRDFTDVRDVIEAYISLLTSQTVNGIYNVCSGIPQRISGILDAMVSMSTCSITVEVDKAKFRPSEVPLFHGRYDKIQQAVGWRPSRKFITSLEETLDWWRIRVADAAATRND